MRVAFAKRMSRLAALGAMTGLAAACVSFPPAPELTGAPRITADTFVSVDGAALGLAAWRAENPRAVILAIHGMNDYSRMFELAGAWWARERSITTYAIDQRGFGRSPGFGTWPGAPALQADLRAAIAAVGRLHPDIPLIVVGHSMGAAVVLTAAATDRALLADGIVLAAPAVWGGAQLSPFYRLALNAAASVAPGKTLTGARAGRQATDNIEILRQMQADPLVIKETTMKSILGVVRIMGEAYAATGEVEGDILFIYGAKDEVIPQKALRKSSQRLGGDVEMQIYPEGWHLLFRDLQAEAVWRGVADWIAANFMASEVSVGAPFGDKKTAGPVQGEWTRGF